jgi:hypothetical protein
VEAAKPPRPAARFNIQTIDALLAQPPAEWLIKGVLPKKGLGVLFGPSGVGKTFAVLDLAWAVARGVDWRERRVHQATVLYVAAEGAGGLGTRMKAYSQYHGVDTKEAPFGVITARVSLLDGDAEGIISAARWMSSPPSLVVLDTLNRVMGGGDENSSVDMGRFVAAAAKIAEELDTSVLIVHHSGKDAARGARGHSSLRAAVDTELEISRDGDIGVLRIAKSRDGQDGTEFAFRLQQVHLGEDQDGDAITSCAVVEADLADGEKRRPKPRGRWQQRIHDTLGFLGPTVAGDLRDAIAAELPREESGRWVEHFKRALDILVDRGIVVTTDQGFHIA